MLVVAVVVVVLVALRLAIGSTVARGLPAVTGSALIPREGVGMGRAVSTPTVRPVRATVVSLSAGLAPDQLRARAAIVSAFGADTPDALRVAWCESRWHPRAIGGQNVGLFQVNWVHHLPGESWRAFVRRLTELRTNVAFAYRLSAGGHDWSAWTCQP